MTCLASNFFEFFEFSSFGISFLKPKRIVTVFMILVLLWRCSFHNNLVLKKKIIPNPEYEVWPPKKNRTVAFISLLN